MQDDQGWLTVGVQVLDGDEVRFLHSKPGEAFYYEASSVYRGILQTIIGCCSFKISLHWNTVACDLSVSK